MSSFFKKGKPRIPGKRKVKDSKSGKSGKKDSSFFMNGTNRKRNKENEDDEIDSDEYDDEVLENKKVRIEEDDEDKQNEETAEQKRLRLAKKYLAAIEIEEKLRSEENDVDENISQRLKDDYLDNLGRLKIKIADKYTEFDENLVLIKNKHQNLSITCLCLSSDDKILFVGSKTPFIVKWDVSFIPTKYLGNINLKEITPGNNNKQGYPTCLALSTDLKFLAVSNLTKTIYIFSPATLKLLHLFEGHRDYVTGLTIRKDTHFLYSCSADRSLKVWSMDEMTYVETLFGHQFPVTSIDGVSRERVITSGGSDQSVRIWKLTEESQLLFRGHSGNIELVKYINDENFLSASDDGSLCSWSAMRKKPLCMVECAHGCSENGEPNWITSIATLFNTDVAASGSYDGFIRIWKFTDNFRTITQIFQIPVNGFVNNLSYASDGKKLFAGIGQEHRLGRWWKLKEAKNQTIMIILKKVE